MQGNNHAYLDLSVLPELRGYTLSEAPAILFSTDIKTILWANAAGASFFGGTGIVDLLASKPSPTQPFISQLASAVQQLKDGEPVFRGFRVARGLRSDLVQCEITAIGIPGGDKAVLLTVAPSRDRPAKREHEIARDAVAALDGFADAAAILDEYGLIIAASPSFGEIDLTPDVLEALCAEVAKEDDRLIKRPMVAADGNRFATGIAHLGRARNLIVLAELIADVDDERQVPEESGRGSPVSSSMHFTEEDQTLPDETQQYITSPDIEPEYRSDQPDAVAEDADHAESALEDDTVAETNFVDQEDETEADERSNDGASIISSGAAATTVLAGTALATASETGSDKTADGSLSNGTSHSDVRAVEADLETAEPMGDASSDEAQESDDTRSGSLLDRWYFRHEHHEDTASRNEEDRESRDRTSTDHDLQTEDPDDAIDDAPMAEVPGADMDRSSLSAGLSLVENRKDAGTAEPVVSDNLDDAEEVRYEEPDHGPHTEEKPSAGSGSPVRFGFNIDDQQVFRSVTPELAATVGPFAASVEGRQWQEVANQLGFDQNGDIARLLEKRDTWSGKTVLWPVEGTDMVVPVDLAALPAFTSERQFEGFRGFGIIRTDDTILDPESRGLNLVSFDDISGSQDEDGETVSIDNALASTESSQTTNIIPLNRLSRNESRYADAYQQPPISDQEQQTDPKDLSDETGPVSDSLSSRENMAFREIGERLRETVEGQAEDIPETHEQSENEPVADDHSKSDLTETGDSAPWSGRGDDGDAASHEPSSDEGIQEKANRFSLLADDDETLSPADIDQNGPTAPTPAAHDAEVSPRDTSSVNTDILSRLPIPVLIYRENEVLFANDELLERSGYETTQAVHEAGGVDALLHVGSDITEGMQLIARDGSRFDVKPVLQTVPWDGDKALLLSFRSNTEQTANIEKMALDMARVSELQGILDTATDGIIIMDSAGVVESLNASAEALFGHDNLDVCGKPVTDLFAHESHSALRDYITSSTEPGVGSLLNDGRELIAKEKNGGLIPLFLTLGQTGNNGKLCAVLRDLTQWKKAEEELVNARRDAESASDHKSDFLARVSHEIRTPLNAIIGFSDVMIEERFGPIDNDRYREYLRDINRSGIHVLDLINDLLDLSKIEAGKMEMAFEAVDLNQIVAETVALLQPQANGQRIIIRTSLSRAVPKVVADARSIRQIILNLVSNAIKFTAQNGQVIVSTVYEGNGEVALRVRDTGRGMNKEEIETAMKPFHQVNSISETRGSGTGLGLPLTRALVEANRAYFDIESEKNVGTIVHVQFPTQRVLAD